MAIIKCKMCGGDLNIAENNSVAVCEYCGTQQTVPSADNEKKLTLFGRANRLRMACEFDKAAGVYESIVADFPEEAEAYWGLVLCKYGIEYVDDPATGKKIPTCHRSSFDSVMDDSNLEQALENADAFARRVYRDEAKAIEELRKGIIEVSGKEDPYDIFICYKETDDSGDRTIDSVIAQEVYDALTEKGYRVFFSRITLEDKLGQEYEPYIFAALHSAKIMLAFGTDYEYYNAVWVKNEWSRFLQLIAAGEKKTLIPCYKNIDAYDMPKEFARLQAQDMGKVGAMQDLLRGIEKILPREKQVVKETVVVQQSGANNKVQALLDRGNMALEDGEWAKADGFFEEVLNNDAKCAWAYVGKTLAQERCKSLDAFVEKRIAIGSEVKAEKATIPANESHIQEMVNKYVLKNYLNLDEMRTLYQYDRSYVVTASNCEEKYKEAEVYWNNHKILTRAESFATGETAEKLRAAKERLFSALRENIQRAKEEDEKAKQTLQERYRTFLTDADNKVSQLRVDAEAKRESDYQRWAECARIGTETVLLARAAQELSKLDGYKESKDLITLCNKRIDEIRAAKAAEAEAKRQVEAAEAARLAAIKAEEDRLRAIEAKARAKKRITITTIVATVAVVAIAAFLVVTKVVIPNGKYNDAVALMENGQYEQAIVAFEAMKGYKESDNLILEAKYREAILLLERGEVIEAYEALFNLGDYSDSKETVNSIYEQYTLEKLKAANVGDYVCYGSCEQDNNASNGKEDIEWLVLEKTSEKMLVISKNGIESQVYDNINIFDKSYEGSTWETCSLRKWLNSSFINSVFSNAERDRIPSVVVSADKNPEYSSNPGNSVEDRVFILSIMEAKKYFNSNDGRRSVPTEYARQQGNLTGSPNERYWWWLRTPGEDQFSVAYVNSAGKIVTSGHGASIGDSPTFGECMIRPAMWIDLSA